MLWHPQEIREVRLHLLRLRRRLMQTLLRI